MKLAFDPQKESLPLDGETWMALWKNAGEAVLSREGIQSHGLEVSLTLMSREEIRDLNREHRGQDRSTDVLSFPQFEDADAVRQAVSRMDDSGKTPEILLGDVVICPKQARLQAEKYGHGEERELVYLFVHSMFHLLGYDHETEEEKKTMREQEKAIMEDLDLPRS